MTPLLLIGGGGHCRSCIDVIENTGCFEIVGIVDPIQSSAASYLGYPWLGNDDELPSLLKQSRTVMITVGQVKSPTTRMTLFERLSTLGAEFPVIVSPRAYVSRHATLAPGTMVMHDAVINAGARTGENCIVNTLALIEHDASIGAHCHLSTAARLNGDAHVGAGSFIGSGAVVHHGVSIGDDCIVAAGAVVAKNLPAGTRFRGTL